MDEITNLLDSFNEKSIPYRKEYSKETGSITSGLLLSYLVYVSDNTTEECFCKTDKEICKALSMGLYELKGAKNRLKKLNLITITRKGISQKSFYKINFLF